MKATVQ